MVAAWIAPNPYKVKERILMSKTRLSILLLILLPLLAGCAEDSIVIPGLRIEIRDARTGAPAAYDATVIVRDGSYVDTLRVAERWPPEQKTQVAVVWAAENRTGTYDVTITHPEYQTWHREGIRVARSGTSSPFDNSPLPKQVYVLAELQPLDGS